MCVDLETLDTRPTGIILEIGAVCFDPETMELGPWFNIECRPGGQVGRSLDLATCDWWRDRQKEGVVRPGDNNPWDLSVAMVELFAWYKKHAAAGAGVWAWGSDFDFPLLANAAEAQGLAMPWRYSQQGDARKVCELLGVAREGVIHHRALVDARQEANAIMKALAKLQGVGAEEAEERWTEPQYERGWNAYRRELIETMGLTSLPEWSFLTEQVRECWCVGVQEALKH